MHMPQKYIKTREFRLDLCSAGKADENKHSEEVLRYGQSA